MLIGSVSEEGNRMSSRPTEAEWHTTLAGVLGDDKATALIAAMKKAHPEKSIRTLSYGVSGLLIAQQRTAHGEAEIRAESGARVCSTTSPGNRRCSRTRAPGTPPSWPSASTTRSAANRAPATHRRRRSWRRTMANAWANFARTGNPSQPGLTWTPFDPDRCQTMVFDNQCRMVNDPEGEVRRILLS